MPPGAFPLWDPGVDQDAARGEGSRVVKELQRDGEVRLGASGARPARWGRWVAVAGSIAVLVGLVPAAGLLMAEPPPLAEGRSSAGGTIRVEKVTFGSRYDYSPGPLWRQLLREWLPPGFRDRLGGRRTPSLTAPGTRWSSGRALPPSRREAGREAGCW